MLGSETEFGVGSDGCPDPEEGVITRGASFVPFGLRDLELGEELESSSVGEEAVGEVTAVLSTGSSRIWEGTAMFAFLPVSKDFGVIPLLFRYDSTRSELGLFPMYN